MWFIETVVLSCIITLGWTLMFSVPKRYILPCLLMTAFGFGLKTALVYQHIHLVVASFFGAMLASFLGVYFSKKIYPTAQSINLTKRHLYDARYRRL